MPLRGEIIAAPNPDKKEKASQILTYHHSRPLATVTHGSVFPVSPLEYETAELYPEYWDRAFRWLEGKVGFYPLFLAVGRSTEDLRMTGYQKQWAKLLMRSRAGNEYRQKGDIPNKVLFSYSQISPQGVFVDFVNWDLVLNFSDKPDFLEKYFHSIFRPSWNKNDWMTYANKKPHSVQLVVPSLDLSQATQVTVRNSRTQKVLENMGFTHVVTGRLTLGLTAL